MKAAIFYEILISFKLFALKEQHKNLEKRFSSDSFLNDK
jgi:hypothetical protein